jgi:hypothetical protein
MRALIGRLPLDKRTHVIVGAAASLPLFAMGVGTGGSCTFDYLRDRGARGYQIVAIEQRPQMLRAVASPSEQLSRIREVVPGAVTDFAHALNVSRQAIYDWQAGKPVSDQNAARINDLARAAEVFEGAGIVPTALLLRRSISADGGFFEWVRLGRAEGAARALVDIVRTEVGQRQKLQQRLGSVRLSRVEADEIGAPALRDEG